MNLKSIFILLLIILQVQASELIEHFQFLQNEYLRYRAMNIVDLFENKQQLYTLENECIKLQKNFEIYFTKDHYAVWYKMENCNFSQAAQLYDNNVEIIKTKFEEFSIFPESLTFMKLNENSKNWRQGLINDVARIKDSLKKSTFWRKIENLKTTANNLGNDLYTLDRAKTRVRSQININKHHLERTPINKNELEKIYSNSNSQEIERLIKKSKNKIVKAQKKYFADMDKSLMERVQFFKENRLVSFTPLVLKEYEVQEYLYKKIPILKEYYSAGNFQALYGYLKYKNGIKKLQDLKI